MIVNADVIDYVALLTLHTTPVVHHSYLIVILEFATLKKTHHVSDLLCHRDVIQVQQDFSQEILATDIFIAQMESFCLISNVVPGCILMKLPEVAFMTQITSAEEIQLKQKQWKMMSKFIMMKIF